MPRNASMGNGVFPVAGGCAGRLLVVSCIHSRGNPHREFTVNHGAKGGIGWHFQAPRSQYLCGFVATEPGGNGVRLCLTFKRPQVRSLYRPPRDSLEPQGLWLLFFRHGFSLGNGLDRNPAKISPPGDVNHSGVSASPGHTQPARGCSPFVPRRPSAFRRSHGRRSPSSLG